MSIYVVSVQPAREESFLAIARNGIDATRHRLTWPQRRLTIRHRGSRRESLAPIFPGYIFLETDTFDQNLFSTIKRAPGFYRFLESNDRIRPLAGADLELVARFVRMGEIIGKSVVTFDENNRIRVMSGPLEGLEGRIVKVDKRKGRAKVRLDLYEESFLVDFGFEMLGAGSET